MKISVGEHARRSAKPKIAYGQTTFESTQRVRDGLSVNEFDQLREDLGVPLGTLESTLSIAHRTLLRRRDTGRFQKDESDRLFRLRRLFDRAVEVLDLALAEIARTDDFPSVNQVLRHIGQAHLDAGRMDLWQQVLAAHLEAIAGEDNGATQGSALNMIVLAQANAGLFDAAEETIATIPFDGARVAGFARLAQGLAADGQVEAARQRLLEARELALSMSSGSLQADALLAVVDGQVIAALLAYQDGE